jgi:hypothetical protein
MVDLCLETLPWRELRMKAVPGEGRWSDILLKMSYWMDGVETSGLCPLIQ